MQNEAHFYFTETQPIISQWLLKITRISWVLALVIFAASFVWAYTLYAAHGLEDARFFHQALNTFSLLPYILAMLYADFIAKSKPRLGTQITLLATFSILAVQVILNIDQSVHIVMLIVLLMILAGVFTNTRITIATAFACMTLVGTIAIFEYMGVEPPNTENSGYFGMKSVIYAGLILFAVYAGMQIMVRDFLTVQEGWLQEKLRVEEIAIRDALTNLYNRYYIERAAKDFFTKAQAHEAGFLLFVDIDNFKMLNTRFGHEGGDSVLKVVAERLMEFSRDKQAVPCRIGGDEFILLLIDTPEGAQEVSRQVMSVISQPFQVFDEEVQITCSVGISSADACSTFSELYRQANTAMHRAKYSGKNMLIEHHQAYSDEELSRVNMLTNLKTALEKKQFLLHYQPQINLDSGKIIGMEALLRWNLNGKQLMPDKFITLAEQYGFIQSITEWVILQACKDCRYLHDKGFDDLVVAVNISADLLKTDSLAQTVTDSLVQTGLSPHALELELTESALFEPGNPLGYEQLGRIREQGVELAIDDFGTGYSNLQYLALLDVQKLKIDKSFIVLLDDASKKAHELVSAIIDIAKRFQLKTVAEGIENSEVAAKLEGMQCDVAQGYYWSRPVTLDSIVGLLEQNSSSQSLAAHH